MARLFGAGIAYLQDAFKADLSAQIPGIVNQERLDWIGFVLTVKGGEAGVTGREKVIKGLEQHCDGSLFDRCGECPYYEPHYLRPDSGLACRDRLLLDAHELNESERISITEEDAETLIAFIKMHEREEIPDDVWDVCMKLYDLLEEM